MSQKGEQNRRLTDDEGTGDITLRSLLLPELCDHNTHTAVLVASVTGGYGQRTVHDDGFNRVTSFCGREKIRGERLCSSQRGVREKRLPGKYWPTTRAENCDAAAVLVVLAPFLFLLRRQLRGSLSSPSYPSPAGKYSSSKRRETRDVQRETCKPLTRG